MSLNIDLGYELHQMDHWNDSVPFDHQLIPKWSLLHLDYVQWSQSKDKAINTNLAQCQGELRASICSRAGQFKNKIRPKAQGQ